MVRGRASREGIKATVQEGSRMRSEARRSPRRRPVRRAAPCGLLLAAHLFAAAFPARAQPTIAVATATAATAPTPSTATPSERALHFDVFLGDRPIGYQRFDLRTLPSGLRVETEARFELTWLRVKAFDYDHRNVELWRDGCLQSISSRTESNGTPSHVIGEAKGPGFDVTTATGHERLDACVGTFSYWDKRQLLQRSKLLNPQTGEYLAVTARPLGRGELSLGDRSLAVERYVLEGKDLEITLAYSLETGEWVALDSPLFGGFTLRYRRRVSDLRELRPTPPSDATSAAETVSATDRASENDSSSTNGDAIHVR
jgi:hypothetical protein